MSSLQRAVYRTHFITASLPPGEAEVGSLWTKTSTQELYICTSVSPLTFLLQTTGAIAGYSTITEEGAPVTARSTLNFISGNLSAVDNPGSSRTDVTLSDTPQFSQMGLGRAAVANAVLAASGQYYSQEFDHGSVSGAVTVDWADGNVHRLTLAGATTLTFLHPQNGSRYLLVLDQDATGSRTVSWPTVRWTGGSAPTLTTTASKADLVAFTYVGSEYYGAASLNF